LVHVISGLGLGGAESMLDKLTLLAIPLNVFVVSLTTDGPIGERMAARGIQVSALGMRGGLRDILVVLRFIGKLRRLRPDIVQTWLYHGDLIGGLVARLAGVRHVVWNVRNSGAALDRLSRGTRAVVRINAWLSHLIPSKILCCSETARRNHIAIGYAKDKFVVIPNGFDTSRFVPNEDARIAVRRELGLTENAILVGLVARFDPQKNHEGFLVAAGMLRRVREDVRFVLIGRGVDSANRELSRWAEEAKVLDAVHLLGERMDVPRLMAALDVAVNASLGEGFSNVVGEAMACGVPCVVTDVGDSAYVVADTGLVVPPDQPQALANALVKMLEMPVEARKTLGKMAQDRVKQNFDIGSVARRYEDFYRGLIAGAQD
jgi:glycosyltransferase involved in cell wall biosynthesis